MKHCDGCDYGPIVPDEALNDRLYWIEVNSGILKGTRCTAWRTGRDPDYPWIADMPPTYESSELSHEAFTDSVVTVIYEIIPEE